MEQVLESFGSFPGAVVFVNALAWCFCALLEAWFGGDCPQALAQRICGDRYGSVCGWTVAQLFKQERLGAERGLSRPRN